jgi:probable HAF family extracellular repeat protein
MSMNKSTYPTFFQQERAMKSDHSGFREYASRRLIADLYHPPAKTRQLRAPGWKTKKGPISVPTTFAVMLYLIFSVTAMAAEQRTMDEHSELARRLQLDMSTNNPSSIRSSISRSAVLEGRSFSIQQDVGPLISTEKMGSVTPYCTNKYVLLDLGTLGGTESFAYAINDSGAIAGSSRLKGDSGTHAFLYSKGKMTDLYPLNSEGLKTVGPTGINNLGQIASGVIVNNVYSPALFDAKTHKITPLGSLGGVTSYGFNGVATSINNSGQAVGYSYIDDINRHAFLYSKGAMTDIGSLGGYSGATAINGKGMIVGFSSDLPNGRAHAFLYANGMMTDIDPSLDFSKSESYARDINNRGRIVGEFLSDDQSGTHAFLYSKGVFTDLGSADSPYTVALGLNDRGQVVGIKDIPYEDTCFDPEQGTIPCTKYKQHAFIYERGHITDLNTLIKPKDGWELTWATDINNRGKIVGYGLNQGKFRAFVLTPRGKSCRKITG